MHFLFWVFGTLKRCLGGAKLDSLFVDFVVSPAGPQDGSRLRGSSILTVAAGLAKGGKKLSKMSLFGHVFGHLGGYILKCYVFSEGSRG